MIIKLCLLPLVLCFDTYESVSFNTVDRAAYIAEVEEPVWFKSVHMYTWEYPPQVYVEDDPEVIFRTKF